MPIVFKSRVFSVEVGKKRFPNGREHEVAIVRHPPSVVLIPLEDDGRVVVIKQYRAPIDRETWEFPAGSLDPDESAEAAARRECEEEIGRVPQRVERLATLFPTPGYCDEQMIFFRRPTHLTNRMRTRTLRRAASPSTRRGPWWRAARSST